MYSRRRMLVRRRTRVPRPIVDAPVYLERTTDQSQLTLIAGVLGIAQVRTFNEIVSSDLVQLFSKYRLLSVTTYFTPTIDPGNSGVVNNTQLTICCCNDPEGNNVAPTALSDPGSFNNHKTGVLVAGRTWSYTYSPKVLNSIHDGNNPVAVGTYSRNPWLILFGPGTGVPHYRLRGFIKSSSATSSQTIDVYHKFRFQVQGIS